MRCNSRRSANNEAEREENVDGRDIRCSAAALGAALLAPPARADDNTVTVGMILPMTGQQASTGKQERAGAELYIQQHGDTVAGKKIDLDRQR